MLAQQQRPECAWGNNRPLRYTLDQDIGLSGVSRSNGKKRKQNGMVEKQRKTFTFAPVVSLHEDLPTVTVSAKDSVDMPLRSHWRTTQKFLPPPNWLMANGSESLEVATQQHREFGQLEAVYPYAASIPPSPAEPLEIYQFCDDSSTLEIPLLPVEDEKEYSKFEYKQESGVNTTRDATVSGLTIDDLYDVADADIAKAVAAALMLVKDPAVSSLVDQELLIKLLRHPSLVEKLVSMCDSLTGQPKFSCHYMPSSSKQQLPLEVGENRKTLSYVDNMLPVESKDQHDMGFQPVNFPQTLTAQVKTRSNLVLRFNKQQLPGDARESRKTFLLVDNVGTTNKAQFDMGLQSVAFQKELRGTDSETFRRWPANFNIGQSSSHGGYVDFCHGSTASVALSSSSEEGPWYKTDNLMNSLFSIGRENFPLEVPKHDDLPLFPLN